MKKKSFIRLAVYVPLSMLAILVFAVSQDLITVPSFDETEDKQETVPNDLEIDRANLQYSSFRSKGLSPEEFSRKVEHAFSLNPDLRLLNVFLKVDEVINPEADSPNYQIKESEGALTLFRENESLIPIEGGYSWRTFEKDLDGFLDKRIKESGFLLQSQGSLDSEVSLLLAKVRSFETQNVLGALGELNAKFKKNPTSFEIFRGLTYGTISVALMTSSYFLDATSLEAKALAMNSVLQKFCARKCDEEEMLVSFLLRYPEKLDLVTEGKDSSLARSLRFYLTSEPKLFLEHLVSMKRSLPEVLVYFSLLSQRPIADNAIEHSIEQLSKVYGAQAYMVASRAVMKGSTFSLGMSLSHLRSADLKANLPSEEKDSFFSKVKMFLGRAGIGQNSPTQKKIGPVHLSEIDDAETKLRKQSLPFKGMVFDEADYLLVQQSILYDSVVAQGNFYLNTQGSASRTANFLTVLHKVKAPLAQLVYRFFRLQYQIAYEDITTLSDYDFISRHSILSPHSHHALFSKVQWRYSPQNPQSAVAAFRLFRKIDARPFHAHFVIDLFYYTMVDPRAMITMRGRVIDKFDYGEESVEFVRRYMDGFEVSVSTYLAEPKVRSIHKYEVLSFLGLWSTISKDLRLSLLEKLIAESPQNTNYVYEAARLHLQDKNYALARDVLLKQAPFFETSSGLEYPRMRTTAASYAIMMNDLEKAKEDLAPALPSGTGDSLAIKARILALEGNREEAIKVLEAAFDRYQSPDFLVSQICLYLESSKLSDAVRIYTSYPKHTHRPEFNSDLGKQLKIIIQKIPEFDIQPFLSQITQDEAAKHRLPLILGELWELKNDALVLQLLVNHRPKDLSFDLNTYNLRYSDDWTKFIPEESAQKYFNSVLSYFQQTGRVAEGLNFIRANFGIDYLPYAVLGSINNLDLSSLIDVSSEVANRSEPLVQFQNAILLGRALRTPELPSSSLNKLTQFFSDPSIESYYYQAGRYLLYGDNYALLSKLSDAENKRVSLYYFLAVRANNEHDLITAARWYKAAIFEGTFAYERSWAFHEAQALVSAIKSLPGILRMRKEVYSKYLDTNPDMQNAVKKIDALLANSEKR